MSAATPATSIREFLRELRKAELQAMFRFWLPNGSVPPAKPDIESELYDALMGGVDLAEQVDRLTANERAIIEAILSSAGDALDIQAANEALERAGATSSEIDATLRSVVQKGLCGRSTETGRVEYRVPSDFADLLRANAPAVAGRRSAGVRLTQRRLELGDDAPESLETVLAEELPDDLRAVLQVAIDRGGVVGVDEFGQKTETDDAASRSSRIKPPKLTPARAKKLAAEFETRGIGTIGGVSLKDYGILIPKQAVVLFQDLVRDHWLSRLEAETDPDPVVEAGVDLYADLDRLARRLERDPLALTREGKVPKRWQDALQESLALSRLEPHLDSDYAGWILDLALRLGIVETHGKQIRVDADRLRLWRKLDVTRQLEAVLSRSMKDRHGTRWSFHQGFLRSIFFEILGDAPRDAWLVIDSIVHAAVSTYLIELEERGVRDALQERRQEDFSREKLTSQFDKLASDLRYWVVHRLIPIGICEIGIVDRRFHSIRPTPLGLQHFGVPAAERQSRILVNPDFEVMLFCEDIYGLRLELAITRFAERQSAERVRRYRVTPSSIREGIRSGLSVGEIRKILEDGSDHPLPETVLVMLDDVGRDLDWHEVRPAAIVRGLCPSSEARAIEVAESLGARAESIGEGRFVVELTPSLELQEIVDGLRDRDLLVRDLKRGPDASNRTSSKSSRRAAPKRA